MRISVCMHIPIPAPRITRYSDCTNAEVDGSMRDIRKKATAITAVPAMGKTLYRPVRLTRTPLPIEVVSLPRTIGRVRRPDVVADTPSTNCMYVGRNVRAPSIANPTTKDSTQHTVNTGLANSRVGRMGAATRLSTQPKMHSEIREPANSPIMVGEPHG